MFRKLQSIILLACCFALPANTFGAGAVTRMSDGRPVSFSQMMEDAGNSDVILVAEVHGERKHHEIELDVIRSLWEKKVPLAIGLEMFQTDNQAHLDEWVEGRITEEAFKPIFLQNWSLDWSLYRDIFIFARDHHIPMIALNVPQEIVTKVARQGFASLTPEEHRNLPSGVTCDLSNPQAELLRRTFHEVSGHEANGKVFSNFCEAQAVRNSGMALNIATNRKRHPGRRLVVLTGIWHAVKQGIPEYLASDIRYRVILPELPELGPTDTTSALVDYLVGSP